MHNKARHVSLSLGKGKLMYRLDDIEASVNLEVLKCDKCSGKPAVVANIVQWGFFEDEYLYFTVCQECGNPVCYKQVVANYDMELKEGKNG